MLDCNVNIDITLNTYGINVITAFVNCFTVKLVGK